MRIVALVFATLFLLPYAAAQQVSMSVESGQETNLFTAPSGATAQVIVHVRFTETAAAYLQVVPTPGNPAYANGTAEQSGWWTEVFVTPYVTQGGTEAKKGSTAGPERVRLGSFGAGSEHQVRLVIHAPAEALKDGASYDLPFTVAADQPQDTGGSNGAYQHASSTTTVKIRVSTPPPSPPATPPAAPDNSTADPGAGNNTTDAPADEPVTGVPQVINYYTIENDDAMPQWAAYAMVGVSGMVLMIGLLLIVTSRR